MARSLPSCLWCSALLLAGCAIGERNRIEVDGVHRNYYLIAPGGLDGDRPLVLVFHGGGPSGANKGRRVGASTGFADLADRDGFLAAFPSSYDGNWQDGRDTPHQPPPEVDDLAFVAAVIDDIADHHPVDRSRIYATGVSNGGFFTNHLACTQTETFAAFANVIGGMPKDYDCAPSALSPMMLMPGTADPLVPFEGGLVAAEDEADATRGALIPQVENQAFWVSQNNCTGEAEITELPDVDPDDSSTVRQERWADCDGESEVVSLIIQGGGHGWPGGAQYLPESIIGAVNQDIAAEDQAWDFFQRHTR